MNKHNAGPNWALIFENKVFQVINKKDVLLNYYFLVQIIFRQIEMILDVEN